MLKFLYPPIFKALTTYETDMFVFKYFIGHFFVWYFSRCNQRC